MRPTMMMVISILLSILPLAGIVGMAAGGMLKTVDGLFMSLILLTISGVFALNALLEARDKGYLNFLKRKKDGGAPPAKAA
ncbi:MAG TPA: hypothetical protein VE825_08135 [Terriglobales bacterium]|nr:hypothetical protein [Terriglobales bacterium]